jgi:hypothetical protein
MPLPIMSAAADRAPSARLSPTRGLLMKLGLGLALLALSIFDDLPAADRPHDGVKGRLGRAVLLRHLLGDPGRRILYGGEAMFAVEFFDEDAARDAPIRKLFSGRYDLPPWRVRWRDLVEGLVARTPAVLGLDHRG